MEKAFILVSQAHSEIEQDFNVQSGVWPKVSEGQNEWTWRSSRHVVDDLLDLTF